MQMVFYYKLYYLINF